MAIDYPYFEQRYAELYRQVSEGGMGATDLAKRNVELAVGLMMQVARAVIADAAKPAEPVGGVPEWLRDFAKLVFDHGINQARGRDYQGWGDLCHSEWPAIESELTRRVAEVVADKDARIAELAKQNLEWEGVYQVRTDVCDKRTAELAAATAEVSRLTKIIGSLDEGRLAADRELVRLRAEVERLSRPVDAGIATAARHFCPQDRVVSYEAYQAERNAREAADQRAVAAEAERDELREAWKYCYAVQTASSIAGEVGRWFVSVRGEFGGVVRGLFDDPNDAVLAAFRAEKGKVQP